MFFERRTARGPPSHKKRCRPSPRTAPPPPTPPSPPPLLQPFSTPASLSAPPRPAMAPMARKYTPIHRIRATQEYRNLSFPTPIRGNLVLLADDASVLGCVHDRPMEFRLMEQCICFLLRTAFFGRQEVVRRIANYYFIKQSRDQSYSYLFMNCKFFY